MPLKQKLEIEEKVRIIRKYLQGKIGLCEGARESGVTDTTFRGWISIYENQRSNATEILRQEVAGPLPPCRRMRVCSNGQRPGRRLFKDF